MRRTSLPFLSKIPGGRGRRPLTPPFSSDFRPRLQYSSQFQCPFLFDLPYEVRSQIYAEVLGNGRVLAEEVEDWGEGKTKKKRKKKSRKSKKTAESIDVDGGKGLDSDADVKTILSLLQTCRLVYTEFLPLMMSLQIVMPTLATLRYQLDCIPVKHHDLITNLTLYIHLPYLLFPVRQLPAPNTWIGRTIKQLQHFDVPLWNLVWQMLTGGSGGGGVGGDMMTKSSATDNSRKGSLIPRPGLAGLRLFHVLIIARDYTPMHPDWPNAPEDTVANLLWEPVLAFARARGWPRRRPQMQTRQSSKQSSVLTGVAVDQSSASGGMDSSSGSFPNWIIDVSWPVGPEAFGRGGPPERILRSPEEKSAGLPFVLRTMENVPEDSTQIQSVDFAAPNASRGGEGSSSSSDENEIDEEDEEREEDEGYRSGSVVEGTRNQNNQAQTQQPQRQWWEA